MSRIEELYNCIENLLQEDGFEEFDDFYDKVENKKIIFNLEDIKKICLIFKEKNNTMEPHNYIDLQRMTFFTIDNYEIGKGFKELVSGLIEIVDYNLTETLGYLNMLMNSYEKEHIKVFADILGEYDRLDRVKICKLVEDLIDRRPDLFKEKGDIILKEANK